MGGCRCSFKNCANTTKTREHLHFFHYPVKYKERCRQWIENAKKPQFYDLDEDQLRNKVVCETHFETCFFPNEQRKRLLQGAIPTLDGDCEPVPPPVTERMKIHDVQVLPANADGTIFVLETENNFHSEKVESYIWTNNGLVLPISKHDSEGSLPGLYSGSELDEVEDVSTKTRQNHEPVPNEMYEIKGIQEMEYDQVFSKQESSKHFQKVARPVQNNNKMADEIFSKTVGNKYLKKIKQHSKDIAILKRMIRAKTKLKRPSNAVILNNLKKQIPSSLFTVVNFSLSSDCELNQEDLEFLETIYAASPLVYQLLSHKYKWKLPNPELLGNKANKNNGHMYCDGK